MSSQSGLHVHQNQLEYLREIFWSVSTGIPNMGVCSWNEWLINVCGPETGGVLFICISSFWQRRTCGIVFLKCTVCDQWAQSAVGASANGRRSLWTTVSAPFVYDSSRPGRSDSHWRLSLTFVPPRFRWPRHGPVLVRHQHMQVRRGVPKNREHGDLHLWLQGKTLNACVTVFPFLRWMFVLWCCSPLLTWPEVSHLQPSNSREVDVDKTLTDESYSSRNPNTSMMTSIDNMKRNLCLPGTLLLTVVAVGSKSNPSL